MCCLSKHKSHTHVDIHVDIYVHVQGFVRLAIYLFTQDGGPSLPFSSMASEGLITSEDITHVPESDRMSGIGEELDSNVSGCH